MQKKSTLKHKGWLTQSKLGFFLHVILFKRQLSDALLARWGLGFETLQMVLQLQISYVLAPLVPTWASGDN